MSGLISKDNLKDVFFSVLYAVLISIGAVLFFALLVKWLTINDSGIVIGNTVIKLLSIFLGVFLGFKASEKGAIKGAFSGLIYTLLSYIIFSIYSGEPIFSGMSVLSLLFGIISGGICGIIAVNTRK